MFTFLRLWRSCCHASDTKSLMPISSRYRFLGILKWKVSVRYEISFLPLLTVDSLFFIYLSASLENIICFRGEALDDWTRLQGNQFCVTDILSIKKKKKIKQIWVLDSLWKAWLAHWLFIIHSHCHCHWDVSPRIRRVGGYMCNCFMKPSSERALQQVSGWLVVRLKADSRSKLEKKTLTRSLDFGFAFLICKKQQLFNTWGADCPSHNANKGNGGKKKIWSQWEV